MNALSHHLQGYLELRHGLGFKLVDSEYLLQKFVNFAQQQKAQFITTQLALRWSTQSTACHPARLAVRYRSVRLFAQYLSGIDSRTEIPPLGLLAQRYQRVIPYLYSNIEVAHLIEAAEKLRGPTPLRAVTYSTLFGLLAVTGMRVGEAIRLERGDVDHDRQLLTVRESKNGQTRLIPIHPTTQAMLWRFEQLRNQVHPKPQSPCFFLSEEGKRLTHTTVRKWFLVISLRIGLRKPADRHGPRIHDLRHHFAISALLNWYRTKVDVETHLPELSTFLGHRNIADTYWYLSATPELLRLATLRLEQSKAGGPSL